MEMTKYKRPMKLSGYRGLTLAIIDQAKHDYLHGDPESREDARQFFESHYYADLAAGLGIPNYYPRGIKETPKMERTYISEEQAVSSFDSAIRDYADSAGVGYATALHHVRQAQPSLVEAYQSSITRPSEALGRWRAEKKKALAYLIDEHAKKTGLTFAQAAQAMPEFTRWYNQINNKR